MKNKHIIIVFSVIISVAALLSAAWFIFKKIKTKNELERTNLKFENNFSDDEIIED